MASSESLTLLEAVGLYVGTIKTNEDHEGIHRELIRFVHWCGPDTTFSEIAPPQVGEYADRLGGTGTTPQAAERLQVVKKFLAYAKKKGLTDVNLAIHLRIRKARTRTPKTRAQDSIESVEFTAQGHAQILAQLEQLKGERAPIAAQIKNAAADKDVRENVPLEAAREQLGHVESRIRTIEETLRFAVIVDPSRRKRARTAVVGSRVSVKDLNTGRETTHTVVSSLEANPLEGKISDISPMGKALVGRSVGQEVEVKAPRGTVRYRISAVS